ncbi:DUF4249 domain-containing protein [Bacteroides sp.]
MKQKYHIYIFLLLTISVSSCYKEIDLDKYRTPPKIVINSAVSPDNVIIASVTRTWFYPESTPYVKLPHAKVELYINDEYIEQMTWEQYDKDDTSSKTPDSVFVSHVTPKAQDRIKIVASAEGYETAIAEETIPNGVLILKTSYNNITKRPNPDVTYIGPDGNIVEQFIYEIEYDITFQDESETSNFYALTILRKKSYSWGDSFYQNELQSTDPVLSENTNILDGAMGFDGLDTHSFLFTDKQIAGQKYTLNLKEICNENPDNSTISIYFYSLSQSYYQYILSIQKISGSTLEGALGNLGFGEPIRIYSNVEGGSGILGTCNISTKKMTIHYNESSTQ